MTSDLIEVDQPMTRMVLPDKDAGSGSMTNLLGSAKASSATSGGQSMLSDVVATVAPVDAFTHKLSVLRSQYTSELSGPTIADPLAAEQDVRPGRPGFQ